MKEQIIQIDEDLVMIDALSAILVIIILYFDIKSLRIILGLPFVLFFPGYCLIAALFVKKNDLGTIERIALSFGLSIAIVPLIGLLLNYTPWGIRLYPILISLSLFTFIMSIIAYARRYQVPEEERFRIVIKRPIFPQGNASKLDRILTVILIGAIVLSVGTLIYVISVPKVGEKFTEFYILGPNGIADDYPTELSVNENGMVIIGVVNREYQEVIYTLKVIADDESIPIIYGLNNTDNSLGPIRLQNEEKWEEPISFRILQPGENIKVQFHLYRSDQTEVYRDLHLWVDVR